MTGVPPKNILSVIGLVRGLVAHDNPRRIFAYCGRAARYVFMALRNISAM